MLQLGAPHACGQSGAAEANRFKKPQDSRNERRAQSLRPMAQPDDKLQKKHAVREAKAVNSSHGKQGPGMAAQSKPRRPPVRRRAEAAGAASGHSSCVETAC